MSTTKNTPAEQLAKILADVFRRHVDAAVAEASDLLQEELEQRIQDRVTELREQLGDK